MHTFLHLLLGISVVSSIHAASIESRVNDASAVFDVDEFLERYGYMARLPEDGDKFHSSEDRESAITKFQKFNGMKITGYLDKPTIAKMKQPRCGVPDMNAESPDQPLQFNAPGYKWKQNVVTWKPTTYSNQLPTSTQRYAFENSFKKWSDVTPLKFEYTYGTPDIEIKFARGEHGDGVYNSFDGRGGVLAHAFYPTNGDTHFDDDEKWLFRSYNEDGTDLEVVATHEFGHALGLGHSNNPESLMAPFYKALAPNWELHNDDVLGIQSLYGVPNISSSSMTSSTTKSTTGPTTTSSTTKQTTTRKTKALNCTAEFDAITSGLDGFSYGFKGTKVYKMGVTGLESGYPRSIQDVFPQAPASPDVAFKVKELNYIYIAKGNLLWRYTNFGLDTGYPKEMKNIPGGHHINFALSYKNYWGYEQVYFFGDKYFWEFNKYQEDLVQGYQFPILTYWKGISESIDAGMEWTDGFTYLFKGSNYLKLDLRARTVVSGYPKETAPAWFGGICGSMPK